MRDRAPEHPSSIIRSASRGDRSRLWSGPNVSCSTATQDIIRGFLQWPLWGRLGWLEVKRRYRRTVIGPFWSSISLAIYVVAVGILGSGLWDQDTPEYLPFLVSGMLIWIFIFTIVTESCGLFIHGSDLFGKFSFDYSLLAYALVWRSFTTLLHNFIVYLIIVLSLAPQLLTTNFVMVIPGIFSCYLAACRLRYFAECCVCDFAI